MPKSIDLNDMPLNDFEIIRTLHEEEIMRFWMTTCKTKMIQAQ
jgi:hypothetical protein